LTRHEQKHRSNERRAGKGRGMPASAAKELKKLTFTGGHAVVSVPDLSDEELGAQFRAFVNETNDTGTVMVFKNQKGRIVDLVNARNVAKPGQMFRFLISSRRQRLLKKHLTKPHSEAHKPTTFETAMENARMRGNVRVAEILSSKDMLSGEEFGERLGRSRQTIDNWRNSDQVIGLEGPGRGVRYPEWQIRPDGQLVRGITEVLELVDGDAWAAYRFLIEYFPDASEDRLVDKLQNDEIGLVLNHIETVLRGAYT